MTAGLVVLLVVLVVAEVAALVARSRALTRRRWAREEAENDAWLRSIRAQAPSYFGMSVIVSEHAPAGIDGIIFPQSALGPITMGLSDASHDIFDDLNRAARLMRLDASALLAIRPSTAAVLRSVAS